MFMYHNLRYDELPPRLTGLWLSDEVRRPGIETAHYMVDNECEDAIRAAGGHTQPMGNLWMGLKIEQPQESGSLPVVRIPSFMLTKTFVDLTINPDQKTLQEELESRFCVSITTENAL